VVWSSEKIGRVTTTLGLGDIEIAGIAGDQQSALFGHLCTHAGEAKCTYGTGCFLLQNIGEQFTLSSQRLLTTLTCSPERKLEYAMEGSIFIGGAVVQWMRDNMKFVAKSSDIEALAKSAESSNGVYFVPAFTGLGAPWWDPNASGLIIGLQRSTEIAHIARAALESIAFQVADVLQAMDESSGKPSTHLRVDGGAAGNDLLMQFQSDLLGIPLERPAVFEATALGAAYLAGLATGFWPSVETLAAKHTSDTVFRPSADRAAMARLHSKWMDAVNRAKSWNVEIA
ncbi:MAG: FGGY-family carbohydrate kinase, partial [Acidobacteriaceae bacterium]